MDARKAADAAGNGPRIQYSTPKEGAPIWVENLVLLNDAPNPQQGLAFPTPSIKEKATLTSGFFLPVIWGINASASFCLCAKLLKTREIMYEP